MSRPLSQDQQADARLIARVLPEMGKYIPGRGIFHYAAGRYWPARLRRFADLYEKAVPVLRRMADHMETEPKRNEDEAA